MWIINKDELYHHGIEGQKWGKRRYQNEDGSLTEEGEERYYGHTKTSLGQRFKDKMTYRDEYGNLHLTSAGRKTAAIGTGALMTTAAAAAGAIALRRKYIKRLGGGNYTQGKINLLNIKRQNVMDKQRAKGMSLDQLMRSSSHWSNMKGNVKMGLDVDGIRKVESSPAFKKSIYDTARIYNNEYNKRLVSELLKKTKNKKKSK